MKNAKRKKSREQLIDELTKSHALFNQAESMGKLGHWEWDVLKNRLVACSEQYAIIFETTQEEALKPNIKNGKYLNIDPDESFNNDVKEFIHEKDRKRYVEVTQAAYQNKESWNIEFQFVTNKSRIVNLLELGQPVLDEDDNLIKTFGIIQDITEFRQNEKRLVIQANILNNISEGASLSRASDGIILYTNPAFEFMFGYDKNEMIGEYFFILFAATELTQQEIAQQCRADLLKFKSIKGEFKKIKKDGTLILTSSSITTINLPEHGDVWVAVSRDITEQRENKKQLQRSQKLGALGKLTGGIAHDFNNLLGVILGYSELLQDKIEKDFLIAEYGKQIYMATQRGAKLTKRLLSFTSMSNVETKKLNINTLILQQEDMLQKALTVRILLILKLADNIWPLMLDESQLQDVILNLCINAMHAMEKDKTAGKVTICTTNQSKDLMRKDLV